MFRVVCRQRAICSTKLPAKIGFAEKSKLAPVKTPTTHALEHFDAFYSKVFGPSWKSIRLALLSEKKYSAVVNPFATTTELLDRMTELGARPLIKQENTHEPAVPTVQLSDLPDRIAMETLEPPPAAFEDSSRLIQKGNVEPLLSFIPATEMVLQEDVYEDGDYFNFLQPEENSEIAIKTYKPISHPSLLVYAFPRGNLDLFPPPQKPICGLFEYYLMDAASLLPVMALDMKDGDDFADFCAAPGGKTLAVAFLQKARIHYCTDYSPSRVKRLKEVLGTYLPKDARSKIGVKHTDMLNIKDDTTYDKILVDVPCTNDRHSLYQDDNNIFHPLKTRDRLDMPKKQKDILTHALCRLRPGGAAVYSTCSLSPVQNDSVVHMTLQSFKKMKFVVTDLKSTFAPFNQKNGGPFRFYDKCRYGQLVLPFLPNNFGPMYICRIERVI